MALPAVVWAGIWAVGMISARMAVRQIIRRVITAASTRAANQAAQAALATAIAAGTLAPTDLRNIAGENATAQEKADSVAQAIARACAANPAFCNVCHPTNGIAAPVNHRMSSRAQEYQAFITGFPPGIEWIYRGKDFDGFSPSICTLKEAKDRYDQFLEVKTGRPNLIGETTILNVTAKSFWSSASVLNQGFTQNAAAQPSPPAMLQWHCSQIAFTIFLTKLFADGGVPIVPQYTPHPNPLYNDPHSEFIS